MRFNNDLPKDSAEAIETDGNSNYHFSVMLKESVDGLQVKKDGCYLDCTLGMGGHSLEILKRGGRVIAMDKDAFAIEAAKERLKEYSDRVTFVKDDFKNAESALDKLNVLELDGILADLGVSSPQIDNAERGFSYMREGALDMRMNRESGLSAADIVNTYGEKELADIFFRYGEERLSRKIAAMIVKERETKPFQTTTELSALVERAYPIASRYKFGHPAKRVFQALRIEVNGELTGLAEWVESIALRLKKGGRIAVITFHSLEDRAVKTALKELEKDCICPSGAPICTCDKRREIKILTKKPIVASETELKENKRSESAKLRIAERI